jgi:hypothetical protein
VTPADARQEAQRTLIKTECVGHPGDRGITVQQVCVGCTEDAIATALLAAERRERERWIERFLSLAREREEIAKHCGSDAGWGESAGLRRAVKELHEANATPAASEKKEPNHE